MLRLAFHLPLRQTEGLMTSIFELLEYGATIWMRTARQSG
jgi:hypothetical protein